MATSTQSLTEPRRRARRSASTAPVVGLVAEVLLLTGLAGTVGLGAGGWVAGLTCAVIVNVALAIGLARHRSVGMAAANCVTLARASLAVTAAALVADSFARPIQVALLVASSALALALDYVDGWLARRTGTAAPLGARFDGEVDAFLILVLSVYVARFLGAWVLAIGGARYVFLAAGWPFPWMRATLPPRPWRKVVTATQGIVLTVAAAGVLPESVSRVAVLAALALLAESFGRDAVWLWMHGRAIPGQMPPGAETKPGPAAVRSPASGRLGASVAAAITVLALLVVWVALVAPNREEDLNPTAFLRVPLDGLVLIALAVLLPKVARRVVAAIAGPVLGLVVMLKILDIGFFAAFNQPFDPLGDIPDFGNGVETLHDAVGRSEANLLIAGGAALIVAVLVVTTLSMFRLLRVAAEHRRFSLRAVTGLGALWLLLAISGAQLLSQTPIASTSTAAYIASEVHTFQADLHDSAVFAKQIRHDRFSNTPADQLLTGLRGKDVLLAFVESYGQVSVQGSSFAPAIDGLLSKGTRQLRSAGFSARSAFIDAPGFGGMSWLGHSTLQSGVWANTQRRYNQLVNSNRFNLTDAFDRAGWRTINFAPADDRDWPEGSSFYHYDKLYERHQLGYRGPGFTYAPMPDQYMFSALQRLELSKPHRPLFAEVDTVSSHMPWSRIPRQIPWNEVGNGSIYNRLPTYTEPSSFWWHPDQVKAAYARSLEYSLNVLVSYVRHYGRKNLVLIVVGDEQPLAIVSGSKANHDVPISIISHDPSVLRRVSGWDWQAGLLPSPQAPVMQASDFRDRFLTAFDSKPTGASH
jgi:phosphatidylglycerophosphate synthase